MLREIFRSKESLRLALVSQAGDVANIDVENIKVRVAAGDSELRYQADEVVNCAYNIRYGGDDKVRDLTRDEVGSNESLTVVAVGKSLNTDVVVGTMRVWTKPDLDMFDLFCIDGAWPHAERKVKPGELGKFSLHPALDTADKQTKAKILQKLWPVGMKLMRERGVGVPYFILHPDVKRFVEFAGIRPVPVKGARIKDSEQVRELKMLFPGYWQNKGLGLYIAPWELSGV